MKKTIKEMTVKELKKFIRKETKKANTRLRRIFNKKKISRAVSEEVEYLKTKGIIGKRNKAILGFGSKTKSELQSQARELEYFNQWKGTETKEVRDKTNLAKYQSFVTNNKEFSDYSYQEWRDLVELFGSTENFIESFGYENLKELHKEATEEGKKVNFASKMRNIMKQSKGASFSQEDIIDMLRSEVFE